MNTSTKYVVSFPIWGYSGQGYEGIHRLEQKFNTFEGARKHKKKVDFVYSLRNHPLGALRDGWRFKEFYDAMTDMHAYAIKGKATISKRTIVVEEEILVKDN